MAPKKRPAAADSIEDNDPPKKRPAAAEEVDDDNPKKKTRPLAKVSSPACAFANCFTGRVMTMNTLMDDLRTQVDAPRTKIRVVTTIDGSTSPVSTR